MSINPQNNISHKTDLVADGWVIRMLPAFARPYAYLMRLDRPIGTWLLLLPAWWAVALAVRETGDVFDALYLGVMFGVGAVVMRGAGCVINDLWDRDFDARVARTQTRPLVTGAVTPRGAILFCGVLFLIGGAILTQMNVAAFVVGLCSIPFIIVYPLMKRITWWPQFILGLTFNFGALMGWAAMTGGIGLPAIYLYIAGIFWTLGYDTIYAHMDKEDDARIGVKSTARRLGDYTVPAVAVFYAAAVLFLYLALLNGAASLMVLPALAVVIAGFVWQVRTLDINDPARCLRLFKFNRDQGLMILAVIVMCVFVVE